MNIVIWRGYSIAFQGVAFLLCMITLVAAAFQVQLAAGVPRPQHRRVNGNGPLACSMCLIYLRSMCIRQKNHNPPLTQNVTNTSVPGFSVLWYIDVMIGN